MRKKQILQRKEKGKNKLKSLLPSPLPPQTLNGRPLIKKKKKHATGATLLRVLMGLTDGRETAKNLVGSRKN